MASKLSVTQLDFDGIKSNLKEYLRSQSEFDGYDFEGSAMNILLDVLAYNTHYNAYYANMIANEMFLDSASMRDSVVSHAKLLGYTPRSTTAALAVVNLTITKSEADDTTTLTLPRFTRFSSQSVDGQSFLFLTTEEQVASNVGRNFTFTNVELKEGSSVSYVFPVDNQTNPKQIFELPDANIDTSTLEVVVQKSSSEYVLRTYTLAEDATEVSSTSEVYYLEEGAAGKYRIYFGDNTLGKKLDSGNLVLVSYISTSGSAANGIKKFRLASSLISGSTSTVTTVSNSASGSTRELTDDIKFSAPKSFVSNNRAVTTNDYITMINKKYPYFDAVNVWGGEENNPPEYGKVFIAAKPKLGFNITQSEKEYVINQVLRPFSILTVTPEFVDVDYNYLLISIRSAYDPRLTTRTAGEIKSNIRTAAITYAVTDLNNFNSSFKLSKLLRLIDDSENSIQYSTAEVYLQKRILLDLYRTQSYILRFGTSLKRSSTAKDRMFSSPGFTLYDKNGIERTCFYEEVPNSYSGIEAVEVISPGSNYTSTPILEIVGDGIGAVAEAVIVNGKFKEVKIIQQGSGYTTATVNIVGGSGRSAELRPVIQGKTGKLRIYYYDDTNVKTVLNPDAGTINYSTGVVTLNSIKPISVLDPNGVIRFHAKPDNYSFESARASLLTLDPYDPASIKITVVEA